MCFAAQKAPATPTPAAAPAPPSLSAETQPLGVRRKRENKSKFGTTDGPTTRRDNTGLSTDTTGTGINL